MAASANTKIFWLIILGAVVVVLLFLPLRLTPVVLESVANLPIQARSQLVQTYEPTAQSLRARTDTLRQTLVQRYGGIGPTQDSLLLELTRRGNEMLQITSHLRDPSKATYDESRQDVSRLLERLKTEALQIEQHLREDYLK